MKPAKSLEYKPDPNKFDLVTHRWNGQGQLVATNHYRSYIIAGSQYFERPVNSGNLWFENNQPAGRVHLTFNEKGHIVTKDFHFDEAHKDYVVPLEGAEKVHFELANERERIVALEAELAAIKAERAPKATVKEVQEGVPAAPLASMAPTLSKRG